MVITETGPPKEPAPRRRWFTFRLRSLFLLLTLIAVALAVVPLTREGRAVAVLRELGGEWKTEPSGPYWLQDLVGEEARHNYLVRVIEYRRVKQDELNKVTDKDIAYVGAFRSLRKLEVPWGNAITDAGLRHLRKLRKLEVLNLAGNPGITDTGLSHLSGLTELRELDLSGTGITDEGLAHLRHLTRLQRLNLCSTAVTGLGLRHVRELAALKRLDIAYGSLRPGLDLDRQCRVWPEILEYLPKLSPPERLYVDRPELTDEHLRQLAQLTSVEEIFVGPVPFGDRLGPKGPGPQGITDECLEWLEAMPNLRAVHFQGTPITIAGLRRFHERKLKLEPQAALIAAYLCVGAHYNAGARSLDIDNDITALDAFEHIRDLPPLTELRIERPISEQQVAHLTQLTNLERLVLYGKVLPPAPAEVLEKLPGASIHVQLFGPAADDDENLANLKHVRVNQMIIRSATDAGLRRIAEMRYLRSLVLHSPNAITAAGLQHLAQMQSLRSLVLYDKSVTDEGLAHLRDSRLTELHLHQVSLPPESLRRLANSSTLRRLTFSRDNKLTNDDVEAIATIAGLQVIHLRSNRPVELDLSPLADLPDLWWLGFTGIEMTDAAIEGLSHLKNLRELHCIQPDWPPATLEKLRAALPNTKLLPPGGWPPLEAE